MPTHVFQGSNVATLFMRKEWAQSINLVVMVLIYLNPEALNHTCFSHQNHPKLGVL